MEAERRTPKPPRATGGEKPAGSHRAPTRRKRSGKPSHAEARAACMRVMQEMFDLPAVLRGRKPVSQLAGLVPLAGWLTCVGVSMAVTVLNDRTMQQLQRSLYLRNFGVFARDMMLRISAVIADISLESMQQYFRVRVAYGWRQQLQDKLHATYFNNMTYYRQTTWDNSISDPGQRITRDIGMLAFQLRVFCTSLVYETLRTIQTCTRIWFALPNERWLIPLILAWTWTNLAVRNFLVPALERGLLMAKINRVEGAFRDAHSKLAQHAESIICFDGVSVEAERLQGRLDERLGLARKMMILGMKERGTMEVLGMIISQALTSCLVQVPMLSSSYHLKVSPNASEQLRMQANANMLAAMQFNEQLVRSLQMCVGHLSRLGRDVMGVSGSAIRIAELLDLINSENTGQPCATEDIAMCFREVDVETPTGVRLIDRLSFTVSKGENLLLTGANGCGKTSILRTLKGLWRPASGTAGFPRGTVFVPQSPYCPTGSLQDQLSYPDILKTAMPSDELRQHLSKVKLAHLVDKELDDPSTDWNLLSLAEKQLLGVARVLFKNPTFAVFDEATSAVDAELEAELFQQLRHAGTTLFTVTHRASLLQYHDKILKIVGGEERSWSLKAIEAGDENALASPRLTPVSRPAAQTHADTDTEVARHLAGRSKKEGAESLAHRPMPKVSDVHKTWMILKLCIPRLTVTDSTVVRLIVFVALMGAGTWIQSGFLASSYGVLKALTMESNPEKYVRFQLQIAGMRIVSLGISLVQQWVQSDVALTWRRRITETITSRYLANGNFYAMRHVDRRITDVDNRIAVEVTQLVSAMSQMTWMILRPVLDAVYCTVLLVRAQLPAVALFTMFAYGIGGVSLIRLAAPDFKKMTQEKERVQAELRSAHERVEQNAEAIAFQDGDSAEERIANKACGSVMSFLHRENAQDSWWSAFNSFVMWRLTYYIQMSLQFFWSLGQGTDTDVLADRGGVQMAETSSYIGSLIQQSLSSLSSLLSMWGGYQMGGQGGQQGPSGIAGLLGSSRRVAEVLLVLDDLDQQREAAANRLSEIELPATPRRGERICLSGASINSPDGQCLASQLTFSVEEQRGDETDLSSLLITGKTGSGKSSVARVLHGIWLPGTGRVGMPSGLATIPQSPLVPTGSLSLMSMLTYPKEFAAGSDDADATAAVLLPLMQRLRVAYLIERNEQGWHEIKDWPNVLSLGEQQCLGVIRVMYHGCEWLLLDEATSAMGEDVAAECYRIFEERGRHFGSAMYSTSIDLSLKLRLLSSCQSICTQLVPVLCARLHGSGAGIRYVTVSQDSDAYRAFHSQELRLGEPNPRGWTLEKIFRLDAPGCGDEEEMDLVLPSASEICPDISEGQMESGSDAGGSDRV